MRRIILFVAIIMVTSSCKNIQKMVDKGEYDEAIIYAAEKLQGEENKNTKYVAALEDAFERVMAQDYARIEYMVMSDRPEFYGKIYNLYRKIERRQSRIRPFLPLISEDGYVAHFKMIDTRPLLREYADKDATYHYGLAVRYLDEYTKNKKHKARSAYRALETVGKYFDTYKDMNRLASKAKMWGTEHVFITSEIGPYAWIDPASREAFYNLDFRGMDKEWIAFHNVWHEDLSYDYQASLVLNDVRIDAEKERVHTYHYDKEIQEGWTYMLDKRGNVVKDTLGNDIKKPKYKKIKAKVTEVERHKYVYLLAEIVVTDLNTGREVENHPIDANIHFNGFSCILRGDKRAIEGADRKHKMDRHLEPFPLDEDMIYEGVISITKTARNKIKKYFS